MKFNKGDVFLVPLINGESAPGQLIAYETRALHCVSCGLFDQRVSSTDSSSPILLDEECLYSTVLVFHIHLERKKWPIVGNQALKIAKRFFPFEKELRRGGVGAKILSEGNLEDFVNAFYGLKPWNLYKRADFFDQLLIDPKKKPHNLVYR